jgi:hypothetical protein
MKYIIYYAGQEYLILVLTRDGIYEYFAECGTKAAAEKLMAALNASEKK